MFVALFKLFVCFKTKVFFLREKALNKENWHGRNGENELMNEFLRSFILITKRFQVANTE